MISWTKTTNAVAYVIKNNSAKLESLRVTRFNHNNFNNFYMNKLLDAVAYNKTIENSYCLGHAEGMAEKVAYITKDI